MKKITIEEKLNKKTSTIFIGNGILDNINEIQNLDRFSQIFIVTDTNVQPILLEKLIAKLDMSVSCIVLDAGEKEKNIASIEKIWQEMHRAQCDRNTVVINLGGGVICDMGGFAASTYMRGVTCINIPTTLLAQVDASIGGKTGIDFDGIKNLIGTFNLPTAVICDPQTLRSLPKREFISGFGEIIKHGLIADKKHFQQATEKKPLELTKKELLEIISTSCNIKAGVIANDEKENGLRKILNFGHTIGHAIEALSLEITRPLLHGEAISIGMIAEAKMSQRIGFLSESEFQEIRKALIHAELPISCKDIDLEKILEKIKSDKKNVGDTINFTLLNKIGSAIINQTVSQDIITEALQFTAK